MPADVMDPTRTSDLDALRAEITTLRAHRAALAAILDVVPVAEHNAAVLASRVNLLVYSAAMEATRAE